ncbi:MAG: D-aminoacyl-tRNA deacylase [Syntrophorhabdaceae bacterium]|nr:D-aminoacyl-tRNA deacylase [Syntrophorhabdaceae bacterium]
MRAVIQRVMSASVDVDGRRVGHTGPGLLVFLGIGKGDTEKDMDWLIEKIVNLRIFEREDGKFDESLLDTGGSLLLVSQFTLYGDCAKGRRPSFSDAMPSGEAKALFETFVQGAKLRVADVQTGVFQAHMEVALINDGPVTLIIDSRK